MCNLLYTSLLCCIGFVSHDLVANCDADFVFTNCTDNYVQFVVTTPVAGTTYSWSFDGFGTATGTSAHFVFPQAGSYSTTLTATTTSGSCTTTSTFTVTTGSYTIVGDVTGGSVNASSLPTLSNSNYVILGKLIIDQNATMSGTDLIMGAGAEIEVADDKTLEISDSNIQGCAIMWRRIKVDPDATLTIRGSYISDAESAIVLLENATLDSGGETTFEDNWQSIRAYFGSPTNVDINVNNTTFTTNNPLTPFVGQSQFLSFYPVGIYVRHIVSAEIGVYGSTEPNLFDDLHTGIRSMVSNTVVVGSNFQDSERGIHASGTGSLVVRGTGKFSLVPMFNGIGSEAIYNTTNSTLSVYDTRMANVRYGIRHANNPGLSADIILNNIQAQTYGILSINNADANYAGVHIEDNLITMNNGAGLSGFGIEVIQSTPVTSTFRPEIFNNEIQLDAAIGGIHANGTTALNISNNDIFLNSEDINYGIQLDNADKTRVVENTITGSGTSGDFNEAIVINSSAEHVLKCNILDDTRVGARLSGACNGSFITANQFTKHATGLYYSESSIASQTTETGDQEGMGNTWVGTYTDAAARHNGNNVVVQLSQYIIHQGPTPGNDYWPPSISTPNASSGNWFFIDPPVGILDCSSSLKVSSVGNGNSGSWAVAQGNYSMGAYTIPVKWAAQQQLFELLRYDTLSGWESEPVLDSFYQAADGGSIGDFTRLKEDIASLSDGMNSLIVQRSALIASIDSLLSTRQHYDSLASNVTGPKQAQYKDLLSQASLQLISLFEQHIIIQDSIDSYRRQSAVQITSLNNTVSAVETFEQNTLTYNTIYAQFIANDTVSAANQVVLVDLANQCPLIGGDAVYQSRALLADTTYYDDKYICQQSGVQLREALLEESAETTSSYTVMPNPATAWIDIQLSGDVENVMLYIYDLNGRLITSTSMTASNSRIEVSDIPRGVYIIHLTDTDSSSIGTTKLVLR